MVKEDDQLIIGKCKFNSRLILGSGKYTNTEIMKKAWEVSGTELITVAVRRINLDNPQQESLLDFIDRKKYTLLPNTAACYTAEEAIRTAHIAQESGLGDMIKLEVIGDQKTLYPDSVELLEATKKLVADGFTVLPYTSDDPVLALKLEKVGASAIMPLGAPIGSGQGILNPNNIKIILENAKVPVIVDAGVGTASDVSIAMELGADGVLLNTAIALAKDPVLMATAMKHAILAGRAAYLAGRIPRKLYASASTPVEGVVR